MRPCAAALVLASFVACDDPPPAPSAAAAPSSAPTTQALELPGIRMRVPLDFVPMEDPKESPKGAGTHELKAMRAKGGPQLGMMRVERHAVDAVGTARTVRQALDRLLEVGKLAMREEGVGVKDVQTIGNTLRYCTVPLAGQSSAPFRRCSVTFVNRKQELVSLVGLCSGPQESACTQALDSLEIEAPDALGLDSTLPTPDYGEKKPFSGPGMTIDLPSGLEPLPEAAIDAYRRSLNPDGNRPVDVVVVRAKQGMPTIVVEMQKAASTGKLDKSIKVKELLESEAARLNETFRQPGLTVVRSTTTPKEDGVEVCAVTLLTERGEIVETHLCAMLYVANDHRGVFTSVRCSAEREWAADVCGPIVASRKFAADKRLAMDDVVPASR